MILPCSVVGWVEKDGKAVDLNCFQLFMQPLGYSTGDFECWGCSEMGIAGSRLRLGVTKQTADRQGRKPAAPGFISRMI